MRKETKLQYADRINGYEFARDKVDDLYCCFGFNNTCKSHFHKQIEMLYVIKGKMQIMVNKVEYTLKSGDFLMCNSFDIHFFAQKRPALSCVLSIPTRFIPYLEKCTAKTKFSKNYLKKSRDTKAIFKLMRKVAKVSDKSDLCQLGYAFLLFSKLSETLGLTTFTNHEDSLIYKIINYIDNNYKEQISLDTLAGHCGYSKSYISKEFNSSFNCNINEYINLKRLQAFIALHEANKDNITNNALAVGFNSARTFYNAFGEHFGVAPKEYFESIKKIK